ncbi:cupin domain-containing protein [Streptomyces sp. NPDC048370]|uniref:cupin domain-containing protein n=1 Tax=Streptomyces sp. NPDC048370 TaxID=3365540 RepID=UPI003710A14E
MTTQQISPVPQPTTFPRPLIVARDTIRALTSVEVGGEVHQLGEHRDFRRHDELADFLPEQGRLSLAWVRLRDGERLDIHEHPTKSVIIVCKGSVRLIGDREGMLAEGDTVCVPPGSLHGFETAPGEEFHGLSVQFEGAGLYEDEVGPRVRFTEAATAAYTDLERLNAARLRRYEEHRLFEPFDDGRIGADPELRRRFLSALYVWSVYFQRMLYARQALCVDPVLREVYAGHLREEFGHDVLLRERHGVATDVYDPILEAAGNWFLMQMHGADEAAKIVIVHMVVEASCDVFGNRTRVAFPHSGTPEESYFDLHAAIDEDHSRIGRDHLRSLSPARFPELMTVCQRAWDQLELAHDRIAAHILR